MSGQDTKYLAERLSDKPEKSSTIEAPPRSLICYRSSPVLRMGCSASAILRSAYLKYMMRLQSGCSATRSDKSGSLSTVRSRTLVVVLSDKFRTRENTQIWYMLIFVRRRGVLRSEPGRITKTSVLLHSPCIMLVSANLDHGCREYH